MRAYIGPSDKFHARLAVDIGNPMHSCHHDLLRFRTINNIFAKVYLENNLLTHSGRGMLSLFSHGSSNKSRTINQLTLEMRFSLSTK